MKFKLITKTFSLAIAIIMLQSCEKEGGEGAQNISALNAKNSHNMGQNCMTCHKSGGSGSGIFNTAGTVYNSAGTATYPNAMVKLYTGANGGGTLKYTLEVDGLGNFFTTSNMDFGTGLYPVVIGNTQTNYMSTPITTGQCNSCHGVSTGKIWTN